MESSIETLKSNATSICFVSAWVQAGRDPNADGLIKYALEFLFNLYLMLFVVSPL